MIPALQAGQAASGTCLYPVEWTAKRGMAGLSILVMSQSAGIPYGETQNEEARAHRRHGICHVRPCGDRTAREIGCHRNARGACQVRRLQEDRRAPGIARDEADCRPDPGRPVGLARAGPLPLQPGAAGRRHVGQDLRQLLRWARWREAVLCPTWISLQRCAPRWTTPSTTKT